MIEGKKEFYKKADKSLSSKGYQYFDGDRDIHGKGRQHSNRPDYIAIKDNVIVIGEIKSPAEGPKSGSWRQIQKTDSDEFKAVRLDVLSREKAGQVTSEVGGHEIIIRGQIPDYYRKIGITYDLPVTLTSKSELLLGYSFPASEENHVKQALKNCNKNIYDKIDTGNGSITYIFDSHKIDPASIKDVNPNTPLFAHYCILKNYKGFFKKKFVGITHLYFFPISETRYVYLGLLGEIVDHPDTYSCKLILEFESALLDALLTGENEQLGDRFIIVEKIPCYVENQPDFINSIKLEKLGKWFSSDISLSRDNSHSSQSKILFTLHGKLNFLTTEITSYQ